ncbi:LysR family transcriptional regulator [Kordiimonas pumila]|uniref:LysR family transcriptional regulator n=1 Tax=Kordiimonas pumila TaxID=2161677 RepID=A0ABV7D1C9_9PROT|nr:LysR family transcriptional regulator [Kordiimonas pumila]
MDHISRVGLFLEVVKHQSFAGAARSLGMTGPALSKQVQALEDRLGVRLLNRTTRQVTLTEQGALYSDRARKALEDLDEAERQLQELKACPTGVLRVNAPMSFGKQHLSKPIAEFAGWYPDVAMEIDFDDRHIDMIAEGYDVVVRIGALKDSSLIARKIASCPILLCASPGFIEKYGMPKTPADISQYRGVIYTRHGTLNDWQFKDKAGTVGSVTLKKSFGANNAAMMLEACLQGVGLAMLPIFTAIEHLQSGELVQLLPDYTSWPERGIYVVFPQNRHQSTKVRLFVDWLTEVGKSLPW